MSSRGECIRITRRRVPSRPPRERERERERVVEFRVGSTMVLYRYTHDCMFTNCLILPANRYQAHFSCRRIDRREKRWTTPTFLDRFVLYSSSIPLFPFAAVEKSFERKRERGRENFRGLKDEKVAYPMVRTATKPQIKLASCRTSGGRARKRGCPLFNPA